nr:carbon-nitrogen hydrolase family protein [Snodgrassella alvi]
MKNDIMITVAQFNPISGDVESNINKHIALIKLAINENVDVIIFPELSLTGYELYLSKNLGFDRKDKRLSVFQNLSDQYKIIIIVDAPILNEVGGVEIGLFIICPYTTTTYYSKMHLHEGETKFFSPGKREIIFDCKGTFIGLAICADITKDTHPYNLANKGASIYLCSMLITSNGYDEVTKILRDYAIKHELVVAMANFSGDTGGWKATGMSAIWNSNGDLLAKATEMLILLLLALEKTIYGKQK